MQVHYKNSKVKIIVIFVEVLLKIAKSVPKISKINKRTQMFPF